MDGDCLARNFEAENEAIWRLVSALTTIIFALFWVSFYINHHYWGRECMRSRPSKPSGGKGFRAARFEPLRPLRTILKSRVPLLRPCKRPPAASRAHRCSRRETAIGTLRAGQRRERALHALRPAAGCSDSMFWREQTGLHRCWCLPRPASPTLFGHGSRGRGRRSPKGVGKRQTHLSTPCNLEPDKQQGYDPCSEWPGGSRDNDARGNLGGGIK